MNWYSLVTNDLSLLSEFIKHYENELQQCKLEISISGNVEKNLANLPGIIENRFANLQEIEAVLNYFNIQLKKLRSAVFKKYLENYNRELSSREVERYVDGDSDVVDLEVLINEIALLRNKWLGVIKALDSKNFMLGHISRLRTSGMNDIAL